MVSRVYFSPRREAASTPRHRGWPSSRHASCRGHLQKQQLPGPTSIPGGAPPRGWGWGRRKNGRDGRWPDRTARTQDAIAGRQLAGLPGQVFAAARLAFLSLSLFSFHKLLTCTRRRLRSCCRPRIVCTGSVDPRRPEGLGSPRPSTLEGSARASPPLARRTRPPSSGPLTGGLQAGL